MAHLARLNKLADELVCSISGRSKDDASFKKLRDSAFRGLRSANYARINQFEVKARLEGLVEKFAVLNRDPLSDALQSRLDELPEQSKWVPEHLALLLALSDRPAEKTKIESLETLAKNNEDDQPTLTWADIVAEDPLDEPGIWDDVERGPDSSEDENTGIEEALSAESESTRATSVSEDDVSALASLQVVHSGGDALSEVRDARPRALGNDAEAYSHTELWAIREMLLMLHGLPSDSFAQDARHGTVRLQNMVAVETASKSASTDLLVSACSMGTSLNRLRAWCRSEQRALFMRSCQDTARNILKRLDLDLAGLEKRYIHPKVETVVSILEVRTVIERITRPAVKLSRVVDTAEAELAASPFALLDELHVEACAAHLAGDEGILTSLVNVLLNGTRTYLRSVSAWVQHGRQPHNDETFFAQDTSKECKPSDLWHERYDLRTLGNQQPSAPAFLRPFVHRFFAMGKSRAFLEAIQRHAHQEEAVEQIELDLPSLEKGSLQSALLSFPQLFAEMLEQWISTTSRDCTPTLRHHLLHVQGLLQAIDSLDEVFCSKDGDLFQSFAETLFYRMDHSPQRWQNRFLLTELAQATLGSAPLTDASTLAVKINASTSPTHHSTSISALSNLSVTTHLPWPLQNITLHPSPPAYTKTLILLLQIHRASFLLRAHLPSLRHLNTPTCTLPPPIRIALQLRHALKATVESLHAHTTSTASVRNRAVRREMEGARDIDAMAAVWAEHERGLERSLLLAEKLKPVREAVLEVLEACERFDGVWRVLVKAFSRSKRGRDEGGKRDEHYNSDDSDERGEDRAKEDERRTQNAQQVRAAGADVVTLQHDLDKSLAFMVAGLRSISRTSGDVALEWLAQKLDWRNV